MHVSSPSLDGRARFLTDRLSFGAGSDRTELRQAQLHCAAHLCRQDSCYPRSLLAATESAHTSDVTSREANEFVRIDTTRRSKESALCFAAPPLWSRNGQQCRRADSAWWSGRCRKKCLLALLERGGSRLSLSVVTSMMIAQSRLVASAPLRYWLGARAASQFGKR